MQNVINLTCPSCGGKLQITNDIERFACGYCGNEHIIRRSGGVITIAPIVAGLKEVKVGVDKTASELAIVRIKEEISNLKQKRINAAVRREPNNGVAIVSLVVLIIIAFILFNWVRSFGFGNVFSIILLLASIMVFFFMIVQMNISEKKVEDDIKRRVESIDKVIAEKEQELKKHMSIVSGK